MNSGDKTQQQNYSKSLKSEEKRKTLEGSYEKGPLQKTESRPSNNQFTMKSIGDGINRKQSIKTSHLEQKMHLEGNGHHPQPGTSLVPKADSEKPGEKELNYKGE